MIIETAPAEPLHVRPPGGWVGDVIPYADADRVWLFYLHEIRDDPGSGTGWSLVSTTDFVRFTDHGTVLPSGGPDAPDFNCYTGSVVADPDTGVLHLFYTGNNPAVVAADGTPLQQVMHATSDGDPTRWVRHPEHTFPATAGYDVADWRDPFVYRPAPDQPWRMLLAARHLDGPARRRGVVAQLRSTDLVRWEPVAPLWDPRRYITQECPDVFTADGWWYLLYSEFSDAFVTRYRRSRSPDGPWLAPELDSVDGRAFYASKTVAFRGRRFLIGWIATREGETDDGAWQWAGTMSTLELTTRPDGTLDVFLPAEVTAVFDLDEPVALVEPGGNAVTTGPVELSAADSYRTLVSTADLAGAPTLIEVTVDIAPDTVECGVLFHASPDGDEAYQIRLEPRRHRVVFDRWPRRRTGSGQWEVSGDQPFVTELERPCPLPPGRHTLQLLIEGTACVAVVDGRVALSHRIYDRSAGRVGVFVGDGAVTIDALAVRHRSASSGRGTLEG